MAQRIVALPLPGFVTCRLTHRSSRRRWPGGSRPVSARRFALVDPEEPRPRPSGAGDLAGDHRQRPPALALPLEPVLEHQHGDGLALPFPHQLGALAQPDRTAADEITTVRHGRGELGQPALAARAQPAMDLLLDLPGDAEQQQLAADPQGRQRAVPSPPLTAQSFRIHLRDRRELGVELGRALGPLARSAAVGFRLRRARRSRRRLMFLAIIERHGLRPPRPR